MWYSKIEATINFFSEISFEMLFSIKIQDVVSFVTSSSFGTYLFIRSNSQFFNYTAYVIFLFFLSIQYKHYKAI